MKRIFLPLLLTIVCCLSVLGLVGCMPVISTITDIDRFSEMQQTADKIDVCFDNYTEDYFKFTIIDEENITEIMEILFTETLSDKGKQLPPHGLNTFIVIYQGESSYSVDVHQIYQNQKLYSFTTSRLADKINDLATELGAWEYLK